jgi:hypothetical protein
MLDTSIVGIVWAITIVAVGPLTGSASPSALGERSLVAGVDNCRSYQGVWEQTHFSGSNASNTTMREAGESTRLVMARVGGDCTFEGTFNGGPIRHSLTGTIGDNRDAGSLQNKRTDAKNCTITLFGSMYVINTPVLGMGYVKNLAWVINGNEPGCDLSAAYTETRWFKRAGHSM